MNQIRELFVRIEADCFGLHLLLLEDRSSLLLTCRTGGHGKRYCITSGTGAVSGSSFVGKCESNGYVLVL